MYSYNRIHNDYDTNVVRVELNSSSSYRPHTTTAVISRATSREPLKTTIVNRSDTFTKHDRRPSSSSTYHNNNNNNNNINNNNNNNNNNGGIIRSETFIVKHHHNHHHHDDSSDEQKNRRRGDDYENEYEEYERRPSSSQQHQQQQPDYGTYTRSKKKSVTNNSNSQHHNGTSEGKYDKDDKSNYATYTRREKRGSSDEKSLYINTDTYRKLDKKRASLLSQESENLNVSTFTKTSKPKRVESFIKKIEKNLWRRKNSKEPSPAPSSQSTDKSDRESTIKRSKNIFNLISGGKKSTREVEIQCKMDDDKDYYSGIATRKSSISLNSVVDQKKKSTVKPLKTSQRYENGSNQRLTSIIKSSNRNKQQQQQKNGYPHYENENNTTNVIQKKSSTPAPAPIRVEIDLRNGKNHNNGSSRYIQSNKKPIGIASPLPQPRSVLKSGTNKNYDSNNRNSKPETVRNQAPSSSSRLQVESNLSREGSDRISFREYREQLRAAKSENRKITDTSDDDLKRSYQQSFFIPM